MNQTFRMPPVDPRTREPQAVQILRACMGSPLFLVATILLTLSALFTSVNMLNVDSMVSSILYQLPSTQARVLFSSYKGIVLFTLGFSILLQLLYVIGFWCAFSAARSRKSPVGTGGLTLIQSMVIVSIVLLGLAALIYAVLFVIASVALAAGSAAMSAGFTGDTSGAAVMGMSWAMMILVIVVVAAVFTLVFVYLGSALNTISRVKYTARTGKAGRPVSMFLIVMNFILFAFGLLSLPVTLMTTFFMRPGAVSLYGIFSLLTQICGLTAMLLLTIQLLIYRRRMQPVRLAENPPRSGYQVQPPHAPASPMEMHVSVEQKQTFTAPIPNLPVDSEPATPATPVEPVEASAPVMPVEPIVAPVPVEPVTEPVLEETPDIVEAPVYDEPPVAEEKEIPVPPVVPDTKPEPVEPVKIEPEKPTGAAVILPPEQNVVSAIPAVQPVPAEKPAPVDPQPKEEKAAAVVLPPEEGVVSAQPVVQKEEPPVEPKKTEAPKPQEEPARLAVKYCVNCGAQLPAGAAFCNQCGYKQPKI